MKLFSVSYFLVLMLWKSESHPIFSSLYPYSLQTAQPSFQQTEPQYQTAQPYSGAFQLQPQTAPTAPTGTLAFGYQTPDGQTVQADGTAAGSYAYRAPDGQIITINYSAGTAGFQTSPAAPLPPSTDPAQTPTTYQQPHVPTYQQPHVPTYQQPQQQQQPLAIYSSATPHQPYHYQFPSFAAPQQPQQFQQQQFQQPQQQFQQQFQQPQQFQQLQQFQQQQPQSPFAVSAADITAQLAPDIFQTTTIEQHHTLNHPIQFAGSSLPSSANQVPASSGYGSPTGYANYGSNPQALQQLQRLLALR